MHRAEMPLAGFALQKIVGVQHAPDGVGHAVVAVFEREQLSFEQLGARAQRDGRQHLLCQPCFAHFQELQFAAYGEVRNFVGAAVRKAGFQPQRAAVVEAGAVQSYQTVWPRSLKPPGSASPPSRVPAKVVPLPEKKDPDMMTRLARLSLAG